MSFQSWIVLAIVASAALFFGRKFVRSLARKGAGAGCCCGDGGGACGKAKPGPGLRPGL